MISGLVIHLSEDRPADAAKALASLTEGRLSCGVLQGRRLPGVLDSPDGSASRDLTERLLELSWVEHIDVTFVALEEDHPAAAGEESAT